MKRIALMGLTTLALNGCATIDARGTYTISGGTGAYARIAGAGTYTETRVLVGARSSSGSCIGGPTSTPASVTAVAHMTGTLTFP